MTRLYCIYLENTKRTVFCDCDCFLSNISYSTKVRGKAGPRGEKQNRGMRVEVHEADLLNLLLFTMYVVTIHSIPPN